MLNKQQTLVGQHLFVVCLWLKRSKSFNMKPVIIIL